MIWNDWNASRRDQVDVFQTLCVPLIKQFFQGYRTIFAYGQTVSGKTHTIEGESDDESHVGIVPRSIDFIFAEMDFVCQGEKDHQFSVKVSFIEIYKEELHDLLDSENYPFKNLHIREDEKGNTTVINAREVSCSSAEEGKRLHRRRSC
ncbi:kinesin-like protein KIF27 isoform X2 [Symsagittifera roscoffensis]|uniref:kinesin-like protein KIF27 isoform X2 n=1 Tax=Symsagittifera roscoffensis TaxID=84072 RepID=UPI00307BAEF1